MVVDIKMSKNIVDPFEEVEIFSLQELNESVNKYINSRTSFKVHLSMRSKQQDPLNLSPSTPPKLQTGHKQLRYS